MNSTPSSDNEEILWLLALQAGSVITSFGRQEAPQCLMISPPSGLVSRQDSGLPKWAMSKEYPRQQR